MEFTAIKGFKDVLPDEVGLWRHVEACARSMLGSFGFREIRPPLIERNEVFSRGIGQDTDIVSKEMYCLTDSKGVVNTLRPEATASVVRAYIQHSMHLRGPVQKLYTIGPMFRHERPQKGRFRQFHQINAELFGDTGPKSDAEVIAAACFLLEKLGLTDLTIKINSLGCPECRPAFKDELKGYLSGRIEGLCEDCRRRAVTNPLRVYDCKVEDCRRTTEDAPSITGYLCEGCDHHLEGVRFLLSELGISFQQDPSLVRGLDYYSRTTFEIQTGRLGSQNAVVGGGRYDGLVKLLGGPDHPAIGFAMGVERLVALLEEKTSVPLPAPDLFIASLGEDSEAWCFRLMNDLRKRGFRVESEYRPKGLKSQMKRAGKLQATMVFIVGPDELRARKGMLKNMADGRQAEVDLSDAVNYLSASIGKTEE